MSSTRVIFSHVNRKLLPDPEEDDDPFAALDPIIGKFHDSMGFYIIISIFIRKLLFVKVSNLYSIAFRCHSRLTIGLT